VLDDYTAPLLALRALYPHNRHLSAKVRAFVDFLASRFGREPPWDSWCRASRKQSASEEFLGQNLEFTSAPLRWRPAQQPRPAGRARSPMLVALAGNHSA
jgi:hypothetical protein